MATILCSATSLTKSQSMRSAKRKSAVELLAESKPFYVKSETVRDSTQVLPTRQNSNFAQNTPLFCRSKSVATAPNSASATCRNHLPSFAQSVSVSPSRSLPPSSTSILHTSHTEPQHHRRSAHYVGGNDDVVQTKLRELLIHCDSIPPATTSSPLDDDLNVEQMSPLTPPAEYAGPLPPSRCHKSLPDLHANPHVLGCSSGSSTRFDPPSTNSAKNSVSALSNRDSGGGSSGLFTQPRSEPAPPYRQQDCSRRDSGSSTQHTNTSVHRPSGTSARMPCSSLSHTQCTDCRPPVVPHLSTLLPPNKYHQQVAQNNNYGSNLVGLSAETSRHTVLLDATPPLIARHTESGMLGTPTSRVMHRIVHRRIAANGSSDMANLNNSNRNCSILRSKSDICERARRASPLLIASAASTVSPTHSDSNNPVTVVDVEHFFDYLGMSSAQWKSNIAFVSPRSNSPVYFSDVSSVDSNRIPLMMASYETNLDPLTAQHNHPPAYNHYCGAATKSATGITTEPSTSVVERNARIIKWLYHCRKVQGLV